MSTVYFKILLIILLHILFLLVYYNYNIKVSYEMLQIIFCLTIFLSLNGFKKEMHIAAFIFLQ